MCFARLLRLTIFRSRRLRTISHPPCPPTVLSTCVSPADLADLACLSRLSRPLVSPFLAHSSRLSSPTRLALSRPLILPSLAHSSRPLLPTRLALSLAHHLIVCLAHPSWSIFPAHRPPSFARVCPCLLSLRWPACSRLPIYLLFPALPTCVSRLPVCCRFSVSRPLPTTGLLSSPYLPLTFVCLIISGRLRRLLDVS